MATAKPTPDNQWDAIEGFNSDKEEYVRLDTDAWLRDHGIREESRKRGEKNFPKADEADFDDIHYKIHAWVNHRGRKCQGDVSQHLADFVQQLNDIEKEEDLTILEHKVAEIAHDATIRVEQRVKHDRDGLTRLEKEVREGTKEYEDFRRAAGLQRLPYYGGRRSASLIILACALIEVILNASLLMDVNPFGLLGALMQMGLITAVNILIGWLVMGFALRCRNLVSRTQSLAAWLVIAFLIPIIGSFNLLVGHFRDSMQAAIDGIVTNPLSMLENDALPRMISDPLGLDSFQSSLLVILGILFFGVASWKGYQWDDPYPGYGRRQRQLNAIKDKYRGALNEARHGIQGVYEDCVSRLADIRHRLEIKNNKWKDLCERGARIVREYPVHLRQYQDDLNFLIAAYRTENQHARTDSSPRFFSERLQIDGEILVPPSFEPPAETSRKGVATRIHEAIEQVQQAYHSASQEYSSLEEITAEGFHQLSDGMAVYELSHSVEDATTTKNFNPSGEA